MCIRDRSNTVKIQHPVILFEESLTLILSSRPKYSKETNQPISMTNMFGVRYKFGGKKTLFDGNHSFTIFIAILLDTVRVNTGT